MPGGVLVRLERDEPGVRVQHPVGVQLLVGLVGLDVDVDAVPEQRARVRDLRLVALRVQLEPELEVRARLAAVRVKVGRLEIERRPGAQQPPGVVREDVRVAADLVHREARRRRQVGAFRRDGAVRHVVEHVAPADGVAGAVRRDVVEFLDLDRRHVAVLLEVDRDGAERGPLVGGGGRDDDRRRLDDQIRLTDLPLVRGAELERRRQVGRIAQRGTVIGPDRDLLDLLLAQRDVVLVVLNPEVPLDEPRRHGAPFAAETRAHLHCAGPGPHLLVGEERHRRHRRRPVTVLAAPLQNRRDVAGERHLGVRGAGGGRRLGAGSGRHQETNETGGERQPTEMLRVHRTTPSLRNVRTTPLQYPPRGAVRNVRPAAGRRRLDPSAARDAPARVRRDAPARPDRAPAGVPGRRLDSRPSTAADAVTPPRGAATGRCCRRHAPRERRRGPASTCRGWSAAFPPRTAGAGRS